jgi:hypothetical protein
MIVVGIITLLSTIGIPTYKRMIQKSRMAEAKLLLGSTYTGEMTFFAEYGSYASNMIAIGALPESFNTTGKNSGNYTYGVHDDVNCTGRYAPDSLSQAGLELIKSLPNYYSTHLTTIWSKNWVFGPNNCIPGFIDAAGSQFTAVAFGTIAPEIPNPPPATSDYDQWTLDNNRTLTHTNDGAR